MLGTMAELGIGPGVMFDPDERMVGIFSEAAKVGNAMATSISFDSRAKEARVRPDRENVFVFSGVAKRLANPFGRSGKAKASGRRMHQMRDG